MKKAAPKNPNDRENKTPSTKGKKSDDSKFTSYDTSKKETESPQRVREQRESSGEQARDAEANVDHKK